MGILEDNDIHIAAICETWLTDYGTATTATIKSFGYSIIHNFRNNKRGGGTALVYKSNIKLSIMQVNREYESFEVVMCMLKAECYKMVFAVVYRTGSLTTIFNQELDLLLSDISSCSDNFVLAGDLNVHFENSNGIPKQILDIFKSYGMKKIVNVPTHINGSSLDQIFIHSKSALINESVSVDSSNTLGSDHFPVFCKFGISITTKYFKTLEYRAIKNIDKEKFSCDINTLLSDYEVGCSLASSVNNLTVAMSELLDTHAPVLTKAISVVDSAPWFDSDYRSLRKLRRQAERVKHRSDEHYFHYKDLCAKATKLANVKKKAFIKSVLEKSQNKPRVLYQMVNRVMDRKQNRTLPDYTENIEQLASDFNQFFLDKIDRIRDSMITSPDEAPINNTNITPMFDFKPTTLTELKEIINESGIKCSPVDLLPQTLYAEHITALIPVLVDLVNLSLASGNVDGIKLAHIMPLIKSDASDPNNLKNYRPVSNLNFLGKLIERVVLKRLDSHLSKNDLHCPEQFAYKKNHSTESLLIKLTNDILIAADEKSATVVMLLDLSAAFDTVDHDVILKILNNEIGIKGNALSWFTSFLKGRCQCIRLGKTLSEVILIKFGVPQGSVLGPVLFNLYLRSIYLTVKKLRFDILGFADDHQISKSFLQCNQMATLTVQMKECFRVIKWWMNKYYLQLNDSKTQIIVFGPRKVLNEIEIGGINMNSSATIRFVSTVKNLGFRMDNQLTFEKQIAGVKKRCFQTIRNIRKIRFLLSDEQCKVIVNSLVISCLDYGNGLYFGINERLINQLQLIQNAAAKAITKKYKHDHVDNDLIELHWLTIKRRIVFKLALLAHKCLLGQSPVYLQNMFNYAHYGHKLRLVVPTSNTRYGHRSFSVAAPRIYNRLPSNLVALDNISIFKSQLKTYLFTMSKSEFDRLSNK